MSAEKFRGLDTTELKNQLSEGEEQMFRLRFQLGMGQTDGIRKLRELKKDRARMLGILRQRELQGAQGGGSK